MGNVDNKQRLPAEMVVPWCMCVRVCERVVAWLYYLLLFNVQFGKCRLHRWIIGREHKSIDPRRRRKRENTKRWQLDGTMEKYAHFLLAHHCQTIHNRKDGIRPNNSNSNNESVAIYTHARRTWSLQPTKVHMRECIYNRFILFCSSVWCVCLCMFFPPSNLFRLRCTQAPTASLFISVRFVCTQILRNRR